MNNLHEALEVCLEAIEQGIDVETSLARYPDIADELRPILDVSANAKRMAAPTPSANVIRRNRVKFLQRAAEMREAQAKSSSTPNWVNSLRRVAAALAVLAIAFISGTGLVRASSGTLPGDHLYPVKRTWEDVSLLFTFDSTRREALEIEHENERVDEVHRLFAEGRSAEVDFAGNVTQQNGNEWLVSGILIAISPQTDLHDGPVFVGVAVRVFGVIQSDGSVRAERIEQLPPGAKLPSIGNSGKESEGESSGSGSEIESLEGVLNSMDGVLWSINGLTTNVSIAEIKGSPTSGDIVKVEGYFDSVGVFIATKIEVLEIDSNGGSGSNDNSNNNNNANESSGSGNDNSNHNNSGPGGGNVNENSSGSGGGNDNGNDSNSGPGSSNDSGTENNSGSGSGSDNSNNNSGP